jgi:hypothetical protein
MSASELGKALGGRCLIGAYRKGGVLEPSKACLSLLRSSFKRSALDVRETKVRLPSPLLVLLTGADMNCLD